ncbi:hypothetical protein MKD50_30640, partial [Cupriavidus sp. WGtm5]|uniref:Uncharacterized protein n=3 Tax=Cupriavidus TaxID=106589 RepID=B2AJ08_CUPTR|nr:MULTISPECIES: hypothetical protein [unclassified Cupriavidus]CAP64058.1 hypothetical protein pRALTA_0409 [Cupriavidus taiwanensis LMG 19424]SOZ02391.1 hypothetical protein CBM2600_P30042 [Cupriavidus taiwanensis]SOZ40613.1 hypothetical protein CBM2605_P30043 [Cupriavidus neocaledonicus]MCO4866075.1 hypothetical protein [Cupriavidus sp. WGlv3]MCO4893710.1 hypothetical protein [Cupriavidus sp. WGtm5]
MHRTTINSQLPGHRLNRAIALRQQARHHLPHIDSYAIRAQCQHRVEMRARVKGHGRIVGFKRGILIVRSLAARHGGPYHWLDGGLR